MLSHIGTFIGFSVLHCWCCLFLVSSFLLYIQPLIFQKFVFTTLHFCVLLGSESSLSPLTFESSSLNHATHVLSFMIQYCWVHCFCVLLQFSLIVWQLFYVPILCILQYVLKPGLSNSSLKLPTSKFQILYLQLIPWYIPARHTIFPFLLFLPSSCSAAPLVAFLGIVYTFLQNLPAIHQLFPKLSNLGFFFHLMVLYCYFLAWYVSFSPRLFRVNREM
jgi:hypothetical protein